MRLWHDDVRKPPEGWVWARTNEEAEEYLATGEITHISLDHDLGLHDLDPETPGAIFLKGAGEATGLDLVKWMIVTGRVPERVAIHSWNSQCARRMANTLNDADYDCSLSPYSVMYVNACALLAEGDPS